MKAKKILNKKTTFKLMMIKKMINLKMRKMKVKKKAEKNSKKMKRKKRLKKTEKENRIKTWSLLKMKRKKESIFLIVLQKCQMIILLMKMLKANKLQFRNNNIPIKTLEEFLYSMKNMNQVMKKLSQEINPVNQTKKVKMRRKNLF